MWRALSRIHTLYTITWHWIAVWISCLEFTWALSIRRTTYALVGKIAEVIGSCIALCIINTLHTSTCITVYVPSSWVNSITLAVTAGLTFMASTITANRSGRIIGWAISIRSARITHVIMTEGEWVRCCLAFRISSILHTIMIVTVLVRRIYVRIRGAITILLALYADFIITNRIWLIIIWTLRTCQTNGSAYKYQTLIINMSYKYIIL